MRNVVAAIGWTFACGGALGAQAPIELGRIAWERGGFEIAKQRAERTGRPMLMLFQEVPG